jgi:hypothetical protein
MPDDRSVESRLQALERRAHVVDLLLLEAEYCRSWDFGTGVEWAAVFTPDGVFELSATSAVAPMVGADVREFEGAAALAAFRDAFNERWTMLHQMHLPAIRVDGDRASAVVWFDCPVIAGDLGAASLSREVGVYRVDYERGAEGWRMKRRVEHPIIRQAGQFLGRPAFAPF